MPDYPQRDLLNKIPSLASGLSIMANGDSVQIMMDAAELGK